MTESRSTIVTLVQLGFCALRFPATTSKSSRLSTRCSGRCGLAGAKFQQLCARDQLLYQLNLLSNDGSSRAKTWGRATCPPQKANKRTWIMLTTAAFEIVHL